MAGRQAESAASDGWERAKREGELAAADDVHVAGDGRARVAAVRAPCGCITPATLAAVARDRSPLKTAEPLR